MISKILEKVFNHLNDDLCRNNINKVNDELQSGAPGMTSEIHFKLWSQNSVGFK